MASFSLSSLAAFVDDQALLPPVEQWQPEFSGDIDIIIKADGRWLHEGDEIKREQLVQLFSSILRRESDDNYYLVTPVEKWRISVEDTPLHIVDYICEDGDIILKSSHQRCYKLSKQYPLLTAEPYPVFGLDRGLSAKLTRNCFYNLVNEAEQSGDELFLRSDGCRFQLG